MTAINPDHKTSDFRSLCAELIEVIFGPVEPWEERLYEVASRARSALADSDPIADFIAQCKPLDDETLDMLTSEVRWRLYEPADTGHVEAALAENTEVPSDEELLVTYWEGAGLADTGTGDHILRGLRAVLARFGTTPPRPDDGEVVELVAKIRHFLAGYRKIRGLDPECIYSIHRGDAMEGHITVSGLTRIADLLERLATPPRPVPLSERLPGPEDCNAEMLAAPWSYLQPPDHAGQSTPSPSGQN